jgi:predicted lipoprotein with Yx(FWY)xxD motif
VRHRGTFAGSLLLSAGLLAAVVAAPASASAHHPGLAPKGTKIATTVTNKYGRVLANTKGRVMYVHTTDKGSVSTCHAACLSFWPPVTSRVRPVAGKGVSVRHLARNAKGQVTYYGHPLYYFVSGKARGNASGEGEAHFFVVSTTGKAIKAPKKKPTKSAGPTGPAEVTTATAGATTVLATKAGRTLYALTNPTEMASFWCTGSCLTVWVPLLTKGAPTAGGSALTGDLSTVNRPDVGTQVTYNGYPVYRYTGDSAAGQDTGQGLFGPYYPTTLQYWYDVLPNGTLNM